jgi:hypothetical protein
MTVSTLGRGQGGALLTHALEYEIQLKRFPLQDLISGIGPGQQHEAFDQIGGSFQMLFSMQDREDSSAE